MNINWEKKPEWADVWLESFSVGIQSGWRFSTVHDLHGEVWQTEEGNYWAKDQEVDGKYKIHYPPETKQMSRIDIIGANGPIGHAEDLERESNPSASSLTNAQQRQMAIDTGRCSDGRLCGEHHDHFDDYCADCPNEPDHLPDASNMIDMVNSPPHYQLHPGYEVYDLRQDLAKKANNISLPHDLYSDWDRAIEYLIRCWEKNEIEDIKKARWYLNKLIEKLEADEDAATR